MKSRTKQYTIARIDNHIVPLLGRKRVGDLRIADVEQFARDVEAGKTARDEKTGPRRRIIVKGGEGAARKVIRALSAMYSFAMRHELDRKSVVWGKSVSVSVALGGHRIIKKNNKVSQKKIRHHLHTQ